MQTGAITAYIDVAQLTLYAFWLFFAGLIIYLLRENKREGYPLVAHDRNDRVIVEGFPRIPSPKSFLLPDGSIVLAPRPEVRQVVNGIPSADFPGAPLIPNGDPLLAGMGPGAYALRADVPDHTFDDGKPKIVPLRAAPAFFLAWEDPDLTGYAVFGSDGEEAGTVTEHWIDRSEFVIRYLEVALTLPGASHHVLLPMNFLSIHTKSRQVRVEFLTAEQFAHVPVLKHPDVVTLLEEDMICAFYGSGTMYSHPDRSGPIL